MCTPSTPVQGWDCHYYKRVKTSEDSTLWVYLSSLAWVVLLGWEPCRAHEWMHARIVCYNSEDCTLFEFMCDWCVFTCAVHVSMVSHWRSSLFTGKVRNSRTPPGTMLRRPFRYSRSFMYSAVSDLGSITESIASLEKESGSVAKLWPSNIRVGYCKIADVHTLCCRVCLTMDWLWEVSYIQQSWQ